MQISKFLQAELKIELHPQKSKLIPLSRGIDFVGFRNFCYYRLVRKRNVRKMKFKINQFEKGCHNYKEMTAIFQGFNAHAKWANTYKIRKDIASQIYKIKHKTLKTS
ncbi:MAG: hypothetical protein KKF39_06465 [Nanoarchaeota archaeon]|nr:hypothetical protein [Nanoarchaeota archaeon]